MIRIAITEAAFKAITATLPLGSVACEAEVTAKGELLIWIEPSAVDRLRAMRGPGESHSDVILRLVELEATRLMAAELAGTGVLVNSVCPGWVATDMGGRGGRLVIDGARSVVWAATLNDSRPVASTATAGRSRGELPIVGAPLNTSRRSLARAFV